MCGIVGVITDTVTKDIQKFIESALYVDALRGMDATGLATVSNHGTITINKKAMPAQDFLQLKSVDDQIGNFNNRVFIGHNRAATRGAINHVNSHPFQHGNITLVHNGSLHSFHTLPDHHKFTVDSDALAHSIHTIGAIETLKLLQGAFALVWYDEGSKKVHMVRNNDRPLSIAMIKDKNMIMYASEANMLQFLVYRSGHTVDKIIEVPTHTLLTFDPSSKNIKEYTSETVEFFRYPYTPYTPNYDTRGDRFRNGASNQKGWSKGERKEESGEKEKEKGNATTDRETVVSSLFKKYNITRGEKLHCCMYSFRPYESGDGRMGVWEGATCHEPFITVMAYGATKNEFIEGEVYELSVISMTHTDLGSFPVKLKEDRALVDVMTKRIVSDEEFYSKIDEVDNKIIDAEFTEMPTIEDEVSAYNKGIKLHDTNGRKKSRKQLQEEILGKKKSIICLPAKVKKQIEELDNLLDETESANVEFIYLQGPRGTIPKSEYIRLTQNGCVQCTGNIGLKDDIHIDWIGENKDQPLCPECVREWDEQFAHYLH